MSEPQEVVVRVKKDENASSEEVEKLREELAEEKDLREDYEAKLEMLAQQKIDDKIAELNIPESEQAYFREHPEAIKAYALGKSGSHSTSGRGIVGLRPEDLQKEKTGNSEREEGYNSIPEMIDDLRAKGDSENIKKLWQHSIHLAKKAPNQVLNQAYDENDAEANPEQKTCVEKVKEAQNRQWRKGFGYKEDE